MTHIINTNSIILFVGNKQHRIEKTDKRYPKILKVFDLPKYEQEEAVLNILDSVGNRIITEEGFEEVNGLVHYQGEALPLALSDKIKRLFEEDLPVEHFEKFWEKLSENPSATSVEELMDFLSYKELPITDDGCFIAYKGVAHDGWSIHGNLKTKVVKGTVDEYGKIYNGVGDEIEVTRREVDDNRENHCSFGLHVGSFEYAKMFGGKIMVVKVNPKDVVSVPSDFNCQKCRVAGYKVVAEYEYEFESPVVSSDGEDNIVSNFHQERNKFIQILDDIIEDFDEDGQMEILLEEIREHFHHYDVITPSLQRIKDGLQDLGLMWKQDGHGNEYIYIG